MSNQWYYHSGDGRAVGPVTSVQLTLLATSGMLSPTAMVRRSDQSDWRRAGEVRGLFPDAPSPAVPVAQAVPVAAPMGASPNVASPAPAAPPSQPDSPFGFLGASPAAPPVQAVDAPPPGVFDFFSDGEPAPAPAPVAKAAPRQAKAAPAKKPASPAPPAPPPPPPMVEIAPAPPAVTPAIPYVDVAEDPPLFFGEPGPTVVPATPASTMSGNPFEFVAGPAAPSLPAPPPMMEAPVIQPEPTAPVVAPPPVPVEPPRVEAPAPAPAAAATQPLLEITGSTVELIGEDYLRLLEGKVTFRVHRGSLQAVTRYESGTVRSVYLKLAQIDGAKLEQRFEAGPGHAGPYPILSFHAGSLTVAMSFSGSDRPYRVFLDRVLHGTPSSAPPKGPAKT